MILFIVLIAGFIIYDIVLAIEAFNVK